MGISTTVGMTTGSSVVTCTTLLEPGLLRLDAVVIRRRASGASRREQGSPNKGSLGPGWGSASSGDGSDEVQFHERRRVLRVAGRELTVPPGEALVVLIAEDERSEDVTVVNIPSAEFRYEEFDYEEMVRLPREERNERAWAHKVARDGAWDAALRQHPTIRTFLERTPPQAP